MFKMTHFTRRIRNFGYYFLDISMGRNKIKKSLDFFIKISDQLVINLNILIETTGIIFFIK